MDTLNLLTDIVKESGISKMIIEMKCEMEHREKYKNIMAELKTVNRSYFKVWYFTEDGFNEDETNTYIRGSKYNTELIDVFVNGVHKCNVGTYVRTHYWDEETGLATLIK